MAKDKAKNSKVKGAAKAGAAYVAIKKLLKGAFAVAAVAAVGKVLRGNKTT
jgi:hypothetical protein